MNDSSSNPDPGRPADLVTFPESAWLAGLSPLPGSAHRALFVDGVPRGFLGDSYRADSYIDIVTVSPGDDVLRFGTTGIDDAIGVQVRTGEVVEVPADRPSGPLFVSTTLDHFTRTVIALLARYPYYRADAEYEDLARAADDVREIVRRLDPAAAEDGTYWASVADDVENGDYSVELLEDRPDRGVRR
jgi:hypothetical protein